MIGNEPETERERAEEIFAGESSDFSVLK